MKISIPEPCQEDWNAMTPVDVQQRHCAACDRTLTDFTAMTDAEIGRHLRRNPGKLCGRFSSRQLDRKLALNGPRNYGGARAMAAAAGLLLVAPLVGQDTQPPKTELSPQANAQLVGDSMSGNSKATIPADPITITGVVMDETGETLIGASVLVKGIDIGAVTDIDGNFSLKVSGLNPVTLIISYTGFANTEMELDVAAMQKSDSITLELEVVQLSEVVLAGYFIRRRTLAHRIFIAPVNRYIVWPAKQVVRNIGDWRRGRFDRRAARQLRKEERLATRATPLNSRRLASAEQVPVTVPPKEVAPVTLSFKASPNPFNDHLHISFSLAERGDYRLELYNAGGKLLGNWEGVGEAGPQEQVLDHQLSSLPAGMYFLELTTKESASVLTLVR